MSSRAYRALVRLYPRSFREEYGEDLVALFDDQRADDGSIRTWTRAIADLATSVPVQHLEVRMSRRSPRAVSTALVVAGTAGVVSMQQHRDVVAPSFVEGWWKLLLAGPALIVILIVLEGTWPASLEPPGDIAWMLMFSTVILAITLTAMGVMLGAVQLVSRRQASRRTTGR